MNPFVEMVLVPKNDYNRLTTQALQGSAPSMTKELEHLRQSTSTLPDDQRNKLEQEIISKHTEFCKPDTSTEHVHSSSSSSIAPMTTLNDEIIVQQFEKFPKQNKWKAQGLYTLLKLRNPQWNSLGQLLNADGTPIQGSNIIDLIDYVTNAQVIRRGAPLGLVDFIVLLKDANVPNTYFSNKGSKRLQDFIDMIDGEQKVIKDEVPASPLNYKRSRQDDDETFSDQASNNQGDSVWDTLSLN